MKSKINKAIRLITLIITIIILIILVKVSIKYILDDNKIENQPTSAKVRVKEAEIKEEIQTAIIDLNNRINKIEIQECIQILKEYLSKDKGYTISQTNNGLQEILISYESDIYSKDFYIEIIDNNAKLLDRKDDLEEYNISYTDVPDDFWLADQSTSTAYINEKYSKEIKDAYIKLIVPNEAGVINEDGSITKVPVTKFNLYNVKNVTELKISEGITELPDLSYFSATLESISIPNGVTSIKDYTFYNCKKLKEINIPNSITTIGNYAFYNCISLTKINIPNSVTNIGKNSFCYCTSLIDINIPSSITSIEDYMFYNCTSLTNIVIPNNIKNIGLWAFGYCTNLNNITMSDNVTSIRAYAFARCTKLTNISIPNSVINMGTSLFYDWTINQNITINGYISSPSSWNNKWNYGCNAKINWKI